MQRDMIIAGKIAFFTYITCMDHMWLVAVLLVEKTKQHYFVEFAELSFFPLKLKFPSSLNRKLCFLWPKVKWATTSVAF